MRSGLLGLRSVFSRRLLSERLFHTSLGRQEHLRAVFDDGSLWKSLAKGKQPAQKGLFGYDGVHTPSDLHRLAEKVHQKAEVLVRRITKANLVNLSPERALWETAKQFDRLSDTLCSVIDMAEAIRQVHPDPNWVQAADQVYDRLCGFMNILNTSVALYERLQRVAHPFLPLNAIRTEDASLFSAAAITQQLLLDFDRSGIALPDREREMVVQLNDAIMQLSRRFFRQESGILPAESFQMDDLLRGVSPGQSAELRRTLRSRGGQVDIQPGSWQATTLYREHPNEDIRRRMYSLAYPQQSEAIRGLDEMLLARYRLANTVGCRSYAELALKEKMARSPEHVASFLRALAISNKPMALEEVRQLSDTKALQMGLAPGESRARVFAWDKEFLRERHLSIAHSNVPAPDVLSPFFSVGTVVQGLSQLFTSLYGISLECEDASGELVWHPSIRKLAVVDEREGRIGTIYADLFSRSGKDLVAAHYTVRCARRVDDDDRAGDANFTDSEAGLEDVLGTEGVMSPAKPGRHQLPIIVMSIGVQPSRGSLPSLMTFEDVMTFFHECGHAIHSMIGRTDFHEVAGTRCATDFVELPSVLMESFAASPVILGSFARHYANDAPLPVEQLKRLMAGQSVFTKLVDNHQITMAAVDQAYHGELPPDFSSTQTLFQVEQEFSVIPPVKGAAWQSNFNHLTGYGGSYYSYLFDHAIAGEIWRRIFASDPLSRDAGEAFKSKVLRFGSSKDPWQCIGDLLEDEVIADGGAEAMARVGQWGMTGDALP